MSAHPAYTGVVGPAPDTIAEFFVH